MDAGTTGSTNDRLNLGLRRRSVDDIKKRPARAADAEAAEIGTATDDSNGSGTQDMWLDEELEALGELKRGAIAAQFPEEFSVDSDILNGASNVWLPARLHPEIAPGEFQEWLKKHGSQLSKMEDSVHRRKSILSYSYTSSNGGDGGDEQTAKGLRQTSGRGGDAADGADDIDFAFGVGAGVRRRNTTGLVRRKTFVERADEEADEDAPFLVQGMQRSSLKRSKLANKRRDSTASSTGSGRRRRRNYDAAAPAVSSPLAPSAQDTTDDEAPSTEASTATATATTSSHLPPPPPQTRQVDSDDKRLSTAEILKQVTAAVDNLGFDDFEICDLDTFDDPSAPKPSAPPIPSANGADSKQNPYQSPQNTFSPHTPPVALQPTASDQEKPSALERKTVTHKKSGSWWQWGRDDSASAASGSGGSNSAAGGEKDIRPSVSLPGTTPWQRQQQQPPLPQSQQQQQQQQHPQLHKAATIAALNPHAAANGPPNMTHTDTISAASSPSASTPSTSSSSSLLKSKLPSPISFLRFNRKSKKERQAADEQQQQQQQTGSGQLRASSNASKSLQAKQQTMSLGLGAGSNKQQGPSSA
ncbi:hypothetical protein H4217_009058, partial [Coemansia sp. RSA 1939]